MQLLDQTDPHWPPDPARIDLNDPDWLTIAQLAYLARASERSIRREAKRRNVSILVGGKRWFSRRRYFAQG